MISAVALRFEAEIYELEGQSYAIYWRGCGRSRRQMSQTGRKQRLTGSTIQVSNYVLKYQHINAYKFVYY